MNINININSKKIKFNYILTAILILAIILRLYKLGFQGAWLDELHTLKEADPNLTFKEFDDVIMFREGIPHFYFLVVRFFSLIFGHTLYTIRLVSVISGVISVYGMYLLGKAMQDKKTGYIAACLLAVHPFLIEYSQEGRSYEMLAMFLILSVYRLTLFLKNINLKNAIYLGIFSGLITNTQPIAIVCVLSIYLIIAIWFLFLKTKKERINYIKYSFLSGIVTLLVFYPVYQIVEKVSKATSSFWTQKPNYEYVVFVLQQITGGNNVLLLISIFSFPFFLLLIIIGLKKKEDFSKNQNLLNFIIVFVWVGFYFLFILIKSYGKTSLILPRYLIALAPGFVLSISLLISYFRNVKIKFSLTLIMTFVFLYSLFVQKDYYDTRVKSQFNELAIRILDENKNKETIVSNWGWLLSFYLDREYTNKNIYEKNLDLYINDVKTNSVIQENFWYIDGNSRPYAVAPETQDFLDKNYTLNKSIDLHDCWAKHYISNKIISKNEKSLKLNQFSNAQFDGTGNLMFFENSKSSSLPMVLEKGKYSIEISCISHPKSKIDNENAKFMVFINDKTHGTFESSEKAIETIKINYNQEVTSNFQLDIAFINDFSKGNFDRNLQISKIEIKIK